MQVQVYLDSLFDLNLLVQSTSLIVASVVKDFDLNISFFIPCFCVLYLSTCLGYTGLSCIRSSFTLDFISIP